MAREYFISCQTEITPLYVDIKKAVDIGRVVKVEVKSAASKTREQLGYYRKIVLPAVREGMRLQGNELSLAEVNQLLNEMFFSKEKSVVWTDRDGNQNMRILRTTRSKSGATIDEMSEFLDRVIRWAAEELCVSIPDPRKDLAPVN